MDKLIDFFVNIFLEYIWNNLFFLRILFIIQCIVFYIIYKKRKELYFIFFPLKYNDLCLKIGTLLNRNKNLWREFGPNSSENSVKDPIKQDLNLWRNIKTNEISPNNRNIRTLIEENQKIILPDDRFLFEKMLNHIIAFEAHIVDETIDYRKHQFPVDFEKLIYSKCEILNKKQIDKISKWLKKKFFSKKYKSFKIKSMYLFGSILKGSCDEVKDIDILLLSEISSQEEFVELSNFIKEIKKEFVNKFKKELSCILFAKNEENGFYDFVKQIDVKKEL